MDRSSPPSEVDPPVRLSARPPSDEPTIVGRVALTISGRAVTFELEIPDGPASLEALLPVFQALTDAVIAGAEARAAASGGVVSCRMGCAACCRQAVPIAEPEARALAAMVEAMPAPRQAVVRSRFEAAERRLVDAGLLDGATALDGADEAAIERVGLEYLGLGLDCPFLEAETCSIYADRPLACREYVVTSPAAACDAPTAETVRRLPLPGHPSRAVIDIGKAETPRGWLLLVQALSFVERHQGRPPDRTAREQVEAVFRRFAGS